MATRVLGGRYTVQDKIGTGGMAIVYRGLDNVLGRTVAIKTMLPQYANDPSFAARFKQEAQAAAALQSPYIVSVYDWGKDDDTYYIVMEYLRGTDLKSGIRRHGALDCRKVAQIGSQISQALTVAHKHDIIHRDVKPQNIMVQPDGNIKVMDFGIARAKNSHLTADNSVLGTAHYVSPEQTQGKDLGPTSDIYSLGIVMYEAATGQVPFQGDDAISVAIKQVNEQPVPPSQLNPNVDPQLEGIILRCMQKNPADRFQTAEELARTLRDYLAGRIAAVNSATAVVPTPMVTSVMGGADASGTQALGNTATTPIPARNARIQAVSATQTAREDQERRRRSHRKRRIFGVLFGLLALAAAVAVAYTFFGRGAETRAIPNLINLTRDQAIEEIERGGFFEVGTVKQEYSDSFEVGRVTDQDPGANKTGTKGQKINIVISKGEAPAADVTVPDLLNKTPAQAEEELTKAGLKSQAGELVFSNDVENGHVAAQSIKPGTTVKAGTTVVYQLSKGPEMVEVPYVVGRGESTATSMLEEAGFEVAHNGYQYSDTVASGLVISQYPTGSQVKGSTVTITVSMGPEPKPDPVVPVDPSGSDTPSEGGDSSGESSGGDSGGDSSGGDSSGGDSSSNSSAG